MDRLAAETRLAVHLTTNGVLLSDDTLGRLRGKIGEIRVSLYDDNDWRSTLTRLQHHGQRFGVNVLVSRERLPGLPALLDELRDLGCRDVLLLPLLGQPALALAPEDARTLATLLDARTGDLTIRLGVCWGEALGSLPRLFAASDCGAGREFVEITSDRRVRACSFHTEALPFDTAADLVALWAGARRELRAPAGCPHGREAAPRAPAATAPPGAAQVRVYSAFASNNSGSYTLLGQFETSARAGRRQHGLQPGLGHVRERVVDPRALAPRADEPRVPQDAQVTRHGRLGRLERVVEVAQHSSPCASSARIRSRMGSLAALKRRRARRRRSRRPRAARAPQLLPRTAGRLQGRAAVVPSADRISGHSDNRMPPGARRPRCASSLPPRCKVPGRPPVPPREGPMTTRGARIWRGAVWAWTALQVGRAVALAPVISAGSVLGAVLWAVAPGLAARGLWRWSSTPGTRLHRARERALLSTARAARRALR